MLPKLRTVLVCTIALLAAATHAQNTINVGPGQTYTTIQAGINAANNGDTVLVAPGTYYEQLNFNAKAITLLSSGGAAKSILDGSGTGTVVFMGSNSSSAMATLDGFTVQHGFPNGTGDSYNYGGAVDADGNAIVRNNVITNNSSCGVDVLDGNVTVQNNHIFDNVGANTAGADCRVNAYGILAHDNRVIRTTDNFLNNLIEQNQNGGIGMYNLDASTGVNITQNTIRSNGLNQPVFIEGSGISIGDFESANIVDNLITGNAGPGVYQFLSTGISLINNTIYLNSVVYVPQYNSEGTELQFGSVDTTATISNNIIVGNQSPYPVISCGDDAVSGISNWDRNLVYNTLTKTASIPCFADPGGLNLYINPQLENPASGDYHLAAGSPAIDAGDNGALLITATDLDANPRLQDVTGTPCAIIDIGAYEYPGVTDNCLITERLTSSLNPSTYGADVTFNAQLTSPSGIPTGTVQFTDGTTVLGINVVSSTGTSSYSTPSLGVGTHTITAAYSPTGTFTPATASLSQVVDAEATTAILTCNPTTINIGATSLLTALVTSANATPTGSITFTDGATTLITAPLTNGAATDTYTGTSTGTHTLTAAYAPTGSYAASSATCSVTVNGLPTITKVAVSPNPSTYGQPVVFTANVKPTTANNLVPSGKVVLTFCHGATTTLTLDANGNGSAIAPTGSEIAEPVSSCSFTGQYSGDTTFNSSTSDPAVYQVTPSPSTTTVVAAYPNPANLAQPVTFTMQVTGTPSPTADPVTGNPIPPGSLQFVGTLQLFDGTSPIATAPVTAINAPTGQAVITLSTLAAGMHSITATYSNDPNLGASTSPAVIETILAPPPPDFTFIGPQTITFRTEATGVATLSLASLNGFAAPIAITCNAPLPPNYLCTLSSSTATLAVNNTASLTLTLHPNTSASLTSDPKPSPSKSGLPVALASLLPLTLLALFRRNRRNPLHSLLLLLCLAAVTTALTACGSDIYYAATPPGLYPITVTATGTNQGSSTPTTHTLLLNANVTP